jgi:enolase
MATLKGLKARQVLDSRGRPTVEVDALSSTGVVGRAIVPSGESTGRHEAFELRDRMSQRYSGLSVYQAIENVTRSIAPVVLGLDLEAQNELDERLIALDGTSNKSRLGANAILGVSLAFAHAAAAARGEELFVHLNRLWRSSLDKLPLSIQSPAPALPLPLVNMISGGLHAGGQLDIQDVLITAVGATSYSQALEMTVAVYRSLGAVLKRKGFESALVGDEGGYGPRLQSNEQAIEIVVDAIIDAGFKPRRDVALAVDVASTHFYEPARAVYHLRANGGTSLSTQGMIDRLAAWVDRYPIIALEDGLAEDDWDGWTELTKRLGNSVQLIGDDLFATQVGRVRLGIEHSAGNSVLIKLNQVGTLTETFNCLAVARSNRLRTVVSARSGETEDTTIADLAVATAAGQIKIGSVARSERLAKYNRLLRIEEILDSEGMSVHTRS